MAFPVTLNGRTYTLTDFEGTNYVDGLPDAFEDFVTHAGDIYNSTSTTSNSIGTGSKTFTVEANKPYQAGTPLRIADAAAPSTNFLDTVVTSYSGTTLVVNSIGYGGSGTKTSWTVNIGGAKTVDGTLGLSQGGTGATDAAGARTNIDVYSKADADSRFLNVSGEASDVTITGTLDAGTITADGLTVAGDNLLVSFQDTNAGGSGGLQFKQSTGAEVGRIAFNDGADLRFFTGSSVTERLNIDGATGGISFYEDTGTTAKFFWDAADERLGIGTSSPSSYGHSLVVAKDASGGATYATITNTNANQFLNLGINADVAEITWDNADSLAFGTTAASTDEGQTLEAMRIGSTGTLTIGKPAEDISTVGHAFAAGGYAFHTRDGNTPLFINRLTSDGDIAEFRKDGATVGSIGAKSDDLYINTGDTGIRFNDGNDQIWPVSSSGTSRDAAIDLGASSNRFKNVFLSEGVYLGGTGSANKLDDYETGYFEPNIQPTSGSITWISDQNKLSYTKIGRVVHITGQLAVSSVSSPSGITRGSLPFTQLNQDEQSERTTGIVLVQNTSLNVNEFGIYPNGGSDTHLEIVRTNATSVQRDAGSYFNSSTVLQFNYTYVAA